MQDLITSPTPLYDVIGRDALISLNDATVTDRLIDAAVVRARKVLPPNLEEWASLAKSAVALVEGGNYAQAAASVIKAFAAFLEGEFKKAALETEQRRSEARSILAETVAGSATWTRGIPVQGPKMSKLHLVRESGETLAHLIAQYAPGCAYAYSRPGLHDVLRRSMERTVLPNAFSDGQPWLKCSGDKLNCSGYGVLASGCGWCANERIELSLGTWPYLQGTQNLTASSAAPEFVAACVPLVTPTPEHLRVKALDVLKQQWRFLDYARVWEYPALPKKQADPGIYWDGRIVVGVLTDDNEVHPSAVRLIGGRQITVPLHAARSITESYESFFRVRESLLARPDLWSSTQAAAARKSYDPAVREAEETRKPTALWGGRLNENEAPVRDLPATMKVPKPGYVRPDFDAGFGTVAKTDTYKPRGGGLVVAGGVALAVVGTGYMLHRLYKQRGRRR